MMHLWQCVTLYELVYAHSRMQRLLPIKGDRYLADAPRNILVSKGRVVVATLSGHRGVNS